MKTIQLTLTAMLRLRVNDMLDGSFMTGMYNTYRRGIGVSIGRSAIKENDFREWNRANKPEPQSLDCDLQFVRIASFGRKFANEKNMAFR